MIGQADKLNLSIFSVCCLGGVSADLWPKHKSENKLTASFSQQETIHMF
jgi:hypothetical protein